MCTRTDDDIGVAGLDIGDLKANRPASERETVCKRVIYRRGSHKCSEGASSGIVRLTDIQILVLGGTVEISQKKGTVPVRRRRRNLLGIPSDGLGRTNGPDISCFGRGNWRVPSSLACPRDERKGGYEGAEG